MLSFRAMVVSPNSRKVLGFVVDVGGKTHIIPHDSAVAMIRKHGAHAAYVDEVEIMGEIQHVLGLDGEVTENLMYEEEALARYGMWVSEIQ